MWESILFKGVASQLISILTVTQLSFGTALIANAVIPKKSSLLKSPPAVTTVLPANVPLVMLVNTEAEAWKELSHYNLFRETFAALAKFVPLLNITGFDYTRNIQPWLGDRMALVFMPKTNSQEKVELDSAFLALFPVQDSSRLTPWLEIIKTSLGSSLKERHYKNITILEWQGKLEETKPTPKLLPETPSLPSPTPTQPSDNSYLKFIPKSPTDLSLSVKVAKPQSLQQEGELAPTSPAKSKKPPSLAIALFDKYFAYAITAKPIEQLIDTQVASSTLAENPQFKKTLEHPQFERSLFVVYENLPEVIPLLQDLATDPRLPFPIPGLDQISTKQLNSVSSVNGFLWLAPEGIRLQANGYYYQPQPQLVDALNFETNRIITRLPAATYWMWASRNLQQIWQGVVLSLSTTPKGKEQLRGLRNFSKLYVGLDIDRDLMSWMDGEYVAFLFPSKRGLLNSVLPNLKMEMAFAVQTSDRPTAEITLKKLERFVRVKSNGEVAIATRNLQAQPVTSWEVKPQSESKSLFAYTWVENDTLIVTTGLGAMAELAPKPYVLLPNTYNFKLATDSFPRPNQGYFYMNMGSSLAWIYGLLPLQLNSPGINNFKRSIGNVRSISASSSTTAEKNQFDMLFVLAPAR